MDNSYGDGNVYRGQVCKDPEIKTIEINRYNADVERLVEAARRYLDENGHSGYCNAIKGPEHEEWYVEEDCDCESKKLKAALEPFKETK